MANHHVRMDEHILPVLKKHFKTNYSAVKSAYGGLWEYFMFIGEK
jgi:S-adenosylmethionine-diacylgycerolhomoserine-N-methlytransferase